MKRICKKCGHSIRRCEHWHYVKAGLWGFLWFVKRPQHHNCLHPQSFAAPRRLKVEVPLPFPEESE